MAAASPSRMSRGDASHSESPLPAGEAPPAPPLPADPGAAPLPAPKGFLFRDSKSGVDIHRQRAAQRLGRVQNCPD
jgi:hypothetical protein